MNDSKSKVRPLTWIGLVLFVGGVVGLVTALVPLIGPERAPRDAGHLTPLVLSAVVQFIGYVLLNRNRFRGRKQPGKH